MAMGMEQKEAKKWVCGCVGILAFLLGGIALITIIVDPYFHYHKPLPFLSYRLYEERYINDGIARHFDYDAMITGTSMSQNFKTSEMDALFGTKSIKAPFSGAGYQEISDNLRRALERNGGLKTVLLAVDYNGLLREYDWKMYEEYPVYLYDDDLLNDVSYLLNKAIFYHGTLFDLILTASGQPGTSMDEYSSWTRETGILHILGSYRRPEKNTEPESVLGEREREVVTETINRNIVQVVNRYPDTEFYLFYTPYSICYWDGLSREGKLAMQIEAERVATELLLECPNVKLYSFSDQYEIICNPDNYNDMGHYSAEINSKMLVWMYEGTGLVTRENYMKRLQDEKEFYSSYDYDSLYAGLEAE